MELLSPETGRVCGAVIRAKGSDRSQQRSSRALNGERVSLAGGEEVPQLKGGLEPDSSIHLVTIAVLKFI